MKIIIIIIIIIINKWKKLNLKRRKKNFRRRTKESSINLIRESNRNLESSLSTLQKKYEKLYYKNTANESQKKIQL